MISSDGPDNPSNGEFSTFGAEKILLRGLDVDYDHLTEEVTLNGQSIVTTTGTFYRVFRAYVTSSGSVGTNDDDIYIHKSAVSSGVPSDSSKG